MHSIYGIYRGGGDGGRNLAAAVEYQDLLGLAVIHRQSSIIEAGYTVCLAGVKQCYRDGVAFKIERRNATLCQIQLAAGRIDDRVVPGTASAAGNVCHDRISGAIRG